ncbi:efflux RND transporter periplasmic adaptor subunit [Limimaricola sp. G21655-S1]|nr:efflux RND transporter periplasmic adaptor subunit [Limimaricola sp. G21655-S1]
MMKTFGSLLVAALLVSGAWWIGFGPETGAEEAPAESAMPIRGPGGAGGGGRAALVSTQPVEFIPYEDVYQAIGTVRAGHRVQVQSQVSGQVTESLIETGAEVEAGTPLLRLDDRVQQLALRTAKAGLAEALSTLSRYEALADGGNAAVTEVQVAEARTAVEIAAAAVEGAEHDLSERVIVAPIGGHLGMSEIERGTAISVGTDIVTISDLDEMRVSFSLPDRALGSLAPGVEVAMSLPTRPGTVYEAVISAVDTEIDPSTRQIAVEARLDAAQVPVLPGSVVNVVLAQPSDPAPSVAALAVTWSREGAGVWLDEDGTARRVPVEILHRAGDAVWLDAPLEPGARVVVEGTQKIREGGAIATATRQAPPEEGETGERRMGAARAAARVADQDEGGQGHEG